MHAARARAIRLSPRDTIDSIRELLAKMLPGTQVWLVAPRRLTCLRKLLNLKRLQYMAERSAVDLRLVSWHFDTRALAREAGIPLYLFLPLRLHKHAQSSSELLETAPERRTNEGNRIDEEMLPARLRWRPRNIGIGAALLSLIVTIALIGILLSATVALIPHAEITLVPTSESVSAYFTAIASTARKEIDYGEAIIPARVTQVILEGQGEAPSSGHVDVSEGHASGEVVFANLTREPLTVPKGTIVRTSSGVNVRFYTVADIEIPPVLYGHNRVGIVALEPGPRGNVRPLTINVVEGELAHSVSALNDKATQGGTIKRVPVVSYKDFDVLRNDLIARLQRKAYDKLVSELTENEFIPPTSVEVQVMEQHYDQVVDQRSDVLSMRMKIVARGTAVDTKALDELATRFLETKANGEVRVIKDSLVVQYAERPNGENDKIHLDVAAHCKVAPMIDLERTKRSIRGEQIAEARAWLKENLPLQEPPQIVVLPRWWDRVPLLPLRIEIGISAG
ncbi:MAG: hypothetical protein U9R48_07955 [Chloroflexota bacterium]|nr:hypothetical protein [Chloroflexota bacterium]